jgi:hypothetical protein
MEAMEAMEAMDNKILFFGFSNDKKYLSFQKPFANFILFTQLIAAIVPLAAL